MAGLQSRRPAAEGLRSVGDVEVGGIRYRRAVAQTPWIQPGDDLLSITRTALRSQLRPDDVVIVSEKALVIAAGLGIPAKGVRITPLARRLANWVHPTEGSRGLSIPEKMQYVVDEVGVPRILCATALAGLTRPLGIHGAFYVVAGRAARAMDGMRPPFEHLLLPPLSPKIARTWARDMAERLGAAVAIVDINDRGGSVRAISHDVIARRELLRVLADNPLGQRDARTPIGYVRRLG